jgi:uncharacterized membrane protein YsdA (DUF1294 family)
MRAQYLFGLPAIALLVGGFLWLGGRTTWHPYAVWLAVASVVTFAFYGLDKLLSKMPGASKVRIPEVVLHLLAAIGGFPGAWLGMFLWNHKSNWKRHPAFPRVLIPSTLIHLVLVYFWLLR